MISDTKFLGFDWPPKMPSYPFKKKRKYEHQVIVVSQRNPEWADVYLYTNEPDARFARNILRKATNNILVEYEKKEIPITVREGFIA